MRKATQREKHEAGNDPIELDKEELIAFKIRRSSS